MVYTEAGLRGLSVTKLIEFLADNDVPLPSNKLRKSEYLELALQVVNRPRRVGFRSVLEGTSHSPLTTTPTAPPSEDYGYGISPASGFSYADTPAPPTTSTLPETPLDLSSPRSPSPVNSPVPETDRVSPARPFLRHFLRLTLSLTILVVAALFLSMLCWTYVPPFFDTLVQSASTRTLEYEVFVDQISPYLPSRDTVLKVLGCCSGLLIFYKFISTYRSFKAHNQQFVQQVAEEAIRMVYKHNSPFPVDHVYDSLREKYEKHSLCSKKLFSKYWTRIENVLEDDSRIESIDILCDDGYHRTAWNYTCRIPPTDAEQYFRSK